MAKKSVKRQKLAGTPRSRVRDALRRLWLRSRERADALKTAGYICEECGRKKSVAKGREVDVRVHHRDGIESWDTTLAVIYRDILCPPERLAVLCVECHQKQHDRDRDMLAREEGIQIEPPLKMLKKEKEKK